MDNIVEEIKFCPTCGYEGSDEMCPVCSEKMESLGKEMDKLSEKEKGKKKDFLDDTSLEQEAEKEVSEAVKEDTVRAKDEDL